MGKVLLDLAVSLDGYIDGPDGADVGLYDWYAATSGPNADIAAETVATTGAIVVGRGVFGRGDDATGWDETPYEVPHFVVTHRPPRAAGGPVDFRFVEGVREAVAKHRRPRPLCQGEQQLSPEVRSQISVDSDVIHARERHAPLLEAVATRLGWEARPVLYSPEALFLGRGGDLAVDQQAGGGVGVVRV